MREWAGFASSGPRAPRRWGVLRSLNSGSRSGFPKGSLASIRSHLKTQLLGSAGGVGVAHAAPRGSGTLVRVTERGGAGDAPTTGPALPSVFEMASHHLPYFLSISVRICATVYPAFTMRDASSASSIHMSQVAAWPSV